MFPTVCRIADQTLALAIDYEVERLQRNLADQYGKIVADFADVDRALVQVELSRPKAARSEDEEG